ncbi:MAG: hypothetical protein HZC55_06215 [Verrucomicrobia bacterium]|nr:hypothetical protein [Verrucomicrobiota bacterium]
MRKPLRAWAMAVIVLLVRTTALAADAPPVAPAMEWGEVFAAQFRDPPNDYRLMQYQLSDQGLERNSRYGSGGFLAFFYQNLYQAHHGGPEQIGPLVEAARKKGMRVWLADDFGYPSGMAGGKVVADNPAYEVRGLAHVSLEGAGAQPAAIELPDGAERIVSAVLYPLDAGKPQFVRGQVVPVEARRVSAIGLPGPWRLCAFVTVIRNRDVQAQSTMPQFKHTGRYPDLLNPEAVARFLAHMHAPIAAHIADLSAKVEGFYTNEPHLMQLHWAQPEAPFACQPWNDRLPGKFREMHGYDLTPLLGALYEGDDLAARRVRMHFQQTVAELLAVSFARQIRDWCQARGISSSGHLLLDEHLAMHVAAYGDYMKFASEFDVPAMDTGIPNPDRIASFNYQFARYTSSIATWKERDRTMCLLDPIITGGGLNRLSPAMPLLFNSVNMACLYGISDFSTYVALQARPDGRATGYSVEDYRALNDYVGRLCLLLRGARPVTSVALYYPIAMFQADFRPSRQFHNTSLAGYRKRQGAWNATEQALGNADLECTIVHPDAVAQSAVDQGRMKIGYGSFRYLILPQVDFVPWPVLEKIQAFEAGGGTVLWVDTKPQVGTYAREDALVAAALQEAKIVRPADLATRITNPYDAQFNLRFQPGPGRLAVARFQREGQPMYLLVNRTEQPLKAELTAPSASQVKIWDPSTGNITGFTLPTVLEIGALRGVVVLAGR